MNTNVMHQNVTANQFMHNINIAIMLSQEDSKSTMDYVAIFILTYSKGFTKTYAFQL